MYSNEALYTIINCNAGPENDSPLHTFMHRNN
jgi:hypothetical protein